MQSTPNNPPEEAKFIFLGGKILIHNISNCVEGKAVWVCSSEVIHSSKFMQLLIQKILPKTMLARKPTTANPLMCPICSRQLKNTLTLSNHIMHMHMQHKHVMCPVCEKELKTQKQLKLHTAAQHSEVLPGYDCNRQFECYVCHRPYKSLPALRKHISTHSRPKSGVCNLCGYTAYTEKILKKHMQRYDHRHKMGMPQMPQMPHKCTICGKDFASIGQLGRHMSKHTGLKTFECEDCLKRFGNKSNLNQHKLTHMEPRHQCPLCDRERKFRSTGNLKKHILTKHKLLL